MVFIHGEETWLGQGKCFPSPGGPSGWTGYLHYLSLPDCASILPCSPFWLCRICLCDTKRKSSFPTNAICANFSLYVWIWSLGNLYIHSKVNVTLVGGMWHLCLIPLETSPCCLLGGKQQFITDQFGRMSVVSSWGMVEEGTGRRTREGINGSFLFISHLPSWSFTLQRGGGGSGEITQLVFLLGNIGGLTSCAYKVCPRSIVWSSSCAFSVACLSHLEGHIHLISLLIHSLKRQPFLSPFPLVPASGKQSSHCLNLCKAFKGARFSKLLPCQRIDAFELCWRRLLRVPWTIRRSNQSILKEVNSEYSLEELMLKLKFQYWAAWFGELTHWKRPWCWERLRAGGEEGNRGWDGWIASLIQ